MRTRLFSFLCASSCGIASISSHHATCSSLPQSDTSHQAKLAAKYIETERLIQGVPGITVAVIKNDALIWCKGFGHSDIENRLKARPESLMRVASISKAFTSAAIGILLQRNQLKLSDSVQAYLKDYPLLPYQVNNDRESSAGEEDTAEEQLSDELCSITVEQVCRHQSGIRHYKNDEFLSRHRYNDSQQPLQVFMHDALQFKPGTNFQYSTYNYSVLAAIIEQITEQKFVHFMQHEIFDRLQMFHTFYETNENIFCHQRSKQYVRQQSHCSDGGFVDLYVDKRASNDEFLPSQKRKKLRLYHAPFVDTSNKFAGGGYLSTCTDVARFGHAMVFGDLLTEEAKYALFGDERHSDYEYGCGWSIYRQSDTHRVVEISHSGGSVGGCSHLLILPQHKMVVAILMNLEDANPYITRQIAKFFL